MKDCFGLFNHVSWQPLNSNSTPSEEEPITHTGALQIDAFQIRCYKASDELTALDVEDIERFFRGCPRCDAPSECLHCNAIDDPSDEPRVAIKLQEEL